MDVAPSHRFMALVAVVTSAYVLSLLAGAARGRQRGAPPPENAAKVAAIEQQFGPFRDGVRNGDPRTMARAAFKVLLINFLGGFLQFTLLGVLLFPIVFLLLGNGWQQGQDLVFKRGTRPLSTVLYFAMGALEWVTYPVTCSVGGHLGLALLWPAWVDADHRTTAVLRALHDGAMAMAGVFVLLFVQSWLEVFYVREVLKRGGTGIPLAPW